MFIPVGCSIKDDFKVEKFSQKQDRSEGVSRYKYSMTKDVLPIVRKDCNWEGRSIVVPGPEDVVTTHVEGYLSAYTYPSTLGPVDSVVLDFCKKYEVCLRTNPSIAMVNRDPAPLLCEKDRVSSVHDRLPTSIILSLNVPRGTDQAYSPRQQGPLFEYR